MLARKSEPSAPTTTVNDRIRHLGYLTPEEFSAKLASPSEASRIARPDLPQGAAGSGIDPDPAARKDL